VRRARGSNPQGACGPGRPHPPTSAETDARWNVFITDPEDVTVAGSLLGAAKSLYQKHVGKAFPEDLLRLAEGSQAERSKDRRPRRRAWASTHVRFAEALMSA